MAYFFKRLFTTLQWQVNYGHQPDSVRGIIGQYGVMANGLGLALVLFFGIGLLWTIWKVIKSYRNRTISHEPQTRSFTILLLVILVLDLPMLISYNYQLRYFLTLMPSLAVLTAFFVHDLHQWAKQSGKVYPVLVNVGISVFVLFSIARLFSLMLLVINDARIPATEFVATLPKGTSLEHTNYPPTLPSEHFEREYNYPIYFVRGDEPLPTDNRFEYNAGEAGLVDRETDYLVIDNFTANKFQNPFYCDAMPSECRFFKQLEAGGSDHYKLLAEFKYELPPYLPQIQFEFINPVIRIYERIP